MQDFSFGNRLYRFRKKAGLDVVGRLAGVLAYPWTISPMRPPPISRSAGSWLPAASGVSKPGKRLSQEEYVTLMVEADPAFRPIHKTRYCLSENGLYYEIDIYPEWKDNAVMEIELYSEDQEIVFPDGIDILREVTGDPAYSNHELARIRPKEE